MFGQSLLSAFGSAACTTNTDQLFITDVQTTSVATYQLNNATTSIPNNTYPGTPSNITYAAGKFGNAAVFNGSSSIMYVNGFDTTTNFSISLWFKTSASSNQVLANNGGGEGGNIGFLWWLNSSGKIILATSSGGANFNGTPSSLSYNDGNWHNAVLNYASNGVYSIYVDNQSVVSETSSRYTGSAVAGRPFAIGAWSQLNQYWFNGSIDQVRIFDSALPQSAATALYNETTTTATYDYVEYEAANPNSIAYYKMSDATDQLGNYNGTATNVNFNTEGNFGFAGAFNGSSSYIDTNISTITSNAGSVSLWVKTTTGTQSAFFGGQSPSQNRFYFGVRNSNFWMGAGDSQNTYTISASSLLDGNWHHVVLTLDGSTAKYYLDGNSTPVDTLSYTPAGTIGVTPLIGAIDAVGTITAYTNGSIDQIRIYDSALSAANVTALYNEIECPAVAVTNAFNTVLYTGNDTNTSYTRNVTGVGFTPDFIWIKSRDTSGFEHALFDSVRGAGASKILSSNTTGVEGWTSAGPMSAFITDGFSIQPRSPWNSNNLINKNGDDFVSWNWKAGGTAVSNTDGTITSQVSANVDAGFSIVKYTGESAARTVGHGLSSAPEMVIIKNLDDARNWMVWHKDLSASSYMFLNSSNAEETDTRTSGGQPRPFGPFASTTFGVNIDNETGHTNEYIAYCFHSVDGYSRISSYVGNDTTNTIYVGFKPRFLLIKCSSNGGTNKEWVMIDSTMDPSTPITKRLEANTSDAEATDTINVTMNNDGWTMPNGTSTASINQIGFSYVFLAIA